MAGYVKTPVPRLRFHAVTVIAGDDACPQALALKDLRLLSADAPGKEILHPVAVVIFGGLISSTLLDTLLTPVMFYLFGEKPLQRLLAEKAQESF